MQKFFTVLGGKIMEYIPKSMGATGRFTIPKGNLVELAKADESGVVQRIVEGMQNPTLDVAYKAQYNYSVAALNLRDGQKSVVRGAVSVVNPGEQAMVKTRLAVGEKGNEVAQVHGFVDASKYPSVNDCSGGFSRRNGVMTSDVRVSDAFGAHISADTAKTEEFLSQFPRGEEIVRDYREAMTDGATQAEKAMQAVREAFAGRIPVRSAIKPTFEKVAAGSKPVINKVDFKPLERYTREEFEQFGRIMEGPQFKISEETFKRMQEDLKKVSQSVRDEVAMELNAMKMSDALSKENLIKCFNKIDV